jgi:tRNA dimethylallyltransferase
LALEWCGEVVSADSRQVYLGLDLGSGKDLNEYTVDGVAVPYHLIDIAPLDREFSVFDYQKLFYETFASVRSRGALPVVVGGTGLYLEAVLAKYRMVEVPENPALRAELEAESDTALAAWLLDLKGRLHNTTDLASRNRVARAIEIAEYSASHDPEPAPDIRPLILGAQWDRSILRQRIRVRLAERIKQGLIDEVEGLHARGVPWERLEQLGLEYRFIAEYIEGKIRNKNDLIQKLTAAIGQFAKRQDTWFRRMERNGFEIHWIQGADFAKAAAVVEGPLLEAGYRRAGFRHGF